MSCPACDEIPTGHNKITCCNGHIQCVKCMINRVKAQYKMCGPGVYREDELNPQICFTCRMCIGDARMPPIFFSLLRITQVCEMTSQAGFNAEQRNRCLKDCMESAKKKR